MASPIKKPRLSFSNSLSYLLLTSLSNTAAMSSFIQSDCLNCIAKSNVISASSFSKVPSKVVIGTHDGSFHCDEALAIGMLKILPRFSTVDVLRTRKPDALDQCELVVDVGATYNPSNNRFDHHQKEFTGTFDGFNTKLSSAGLVYKHYGKEIIRTLLENEKGLSDQFYDVAYTKLYKDFMEHIDGIDNGVSISGDGEQKYHISTSLSSRVGQLNPAWNEEQTADIMNDRFKAAMQLCCSEFVSQIMFMAKSWWPARSIVQKALDERYSVDPSGKIIVLAQACPWKEHLFDLETEEKVMFTIYPDSGGSYRIQAVPIEPSSFTSRKIIKQEWNGVRDEDLSKLSGIPNCIFCHANGFIGGNQNKDGAIEMARQSL